MITTIPYTYRDGSNYKTHGELVLDGAITDEQREQLKGTLFEGDKFIPAQIGLEHLGFESTWGSFPEEDLDHAWHELDVDEITVSERSEFRTKDPVGEFVAKMVAAAEAGWDEDAYDPVDRPNPTRYLAFLSTRNFDFTALGLTEDGARLALQEGWRKHTEQSLASSQTDPSSNAMYAWEELADDVNVVAIIPGQCLRDGESLSILPF